MEIIDTPINIESPIKKRGLWKITGEKKCTICEKIKKIEEFKWNPARNGPYPSCALCLSEYKNNWKHKNKDKVKEYERQYKKAHRKEISEKIKPTRKRYYQANKEKLKENRRKYYQENIEKAKACIRNCDRKYRFTLGDTVIYMNALYKAIRRTKWGFYIEKIGPHLDDYYYPFAPDTAIVVRKELTKLRN